MTDTPEAQSTAKVEMITMFKKNAAGEVTDSVIVTNTGHEAPEGEI
jgi:hypothetical protein